MAFIKPILEKKTNVVLQFVSIRDTELDRTSTDAKALEEYRNGNFAIESNFVWKGDKTLFTFKPISMAEWETIQMEAYSELMTKMVASSTENMSDEERSIQQFTHSLFIESTLAVKVFNKTFRELQVGEEHFKRSDIIDAIPVDIKKELGSYVVLSCNVVSFL